VQKARLDAKIVYVKNGTIKQNIENRNLHIRNFGTHRYCEVLQLQHELLEERLSNKIQNTVIIVEHPDVITLGARHSANKLLVSMDELAQKNIDVVEVRRGGGTTAHNPGQLIFYPILNLKEMSLEINEYIRKLESIGKELLMQYDLDSDIKKGYPGLWVGEKKIASIGVRVSKFVTYHGMAINIQNDLSIFEFIKPCGLDSVKMTSLANETGKLYRMDNIKYKLARLLRRHFS
jgi:lipoate-protein ligase B